MSNTVPSRTGVPLACQRADAFPASPRRRWTVPLIALTAVLALTAIVLEIVFLKTNRRPSDAPVREQRDPPPTAAPSPAPSGAPSILPPSAPATLTRAQRMPTPNPASSPERPLPAPSHEMLLEALGGLTAAHLYQTYLNIGLLADGVEGEIYSQADARKLLTTVIGLMDTVDKQLARLPEESLKAEERKALLRIRSLSVLLRTQIKEVGAYWENGDKENAQRFHKAREEAWIGLAELMDLKN